MEVTAPAAPPAVNGQLVVKERALRRTAEGIVASISHVTLSGRRAVVVRGREVHDIVLRLEVPLGVPARETAAAVRGALRSQFAALTGHRVAAIDVTFTAFTAPEQLS